MFSDINWKSNTFCNARCVVFRRGIVWRHSPPKTTFTDVVFISQEFTGAFTASCAHLAPKFQSLHVILTRPSDIFGCEKKLISYLFTNKVIIFIPFQNTNGKNVLPLYKLLRVTEGECSYVIWNSLLYSEINCEQIYSILRLLPYKLDIASFASEYQPFKYICDTFIKAFI